MPDMSNCNQTVLYDRKRAAKATPITAEKPGKAREVASEVELWADLATSVEVPDCPVGLEKATDDDDEPDVVVADTVGRLGNSAVLEKVWQLEEEGTRTLYGWVVIGPRDSGGWE
jgi:hypothetical protein